MRLVLAAVGRLKPGPERQLAERYRERAGKLGRSIGWRDLEIVEVAESRSRDAARRMVEESIAIATLVPDGAAIIVLDQRGRSLASGEFAQQLGRWREADRPACVAVIGGPDGIAPGLHEKADLVLALGAMTWPHQLVRIMFLEQLYRAATILTGHPYHRA